MTTSVGSDPYKALRFRLKIHQTVVAGFSKARRLTLISGSTPRLAIENRGGKGSVSKHPPITLERGITQDAGFQQWASLIWKYGSAMNSSVSLGSIRRDVDVALFDEAGKLITVYAIVGAWVSEYRAIPDLDAGSSTNAIEHLKLENEGWSER